MERVFLVVVLATLVHSAAGFGLALVAMPLLVIIIGLEQAAPLVSLIGISSMLIVVMRYRAGVQWAAIRGLAIGSVIGIPVGVLALRAVNESLVVFLLGVFVTGYALFALFSPRLPALENPGWGYGLGLMSGILGGAYNTGGPPLVIYGNSRSWEPSTFKGNLQILLLIHSVVITASHALNGNYTAQVLKLYVYSVPAFLVGIFLGYTLDRFMDSHLFHRMTLLLLIVLGLQLIVSAVR